MADNIKKMGWLAFSVIMVFGALLIQLDLGQKLDDVGTYAEKIWSDSLEEAIVSGEVKAEADYDKAYLVLLLQTLDYSSGDHRIEIYIDGCSYPIVNTYEDIRAMRQAIDQLSANRFMCIDVVDQKGYVIQKNFESY